MALGAALFATALSGCGEPEEDVRIFQVEAKNESREYVQFWLTAYGRPEGEVEGRYVDLLDGALPGTYHQANASVYAKEVYRFEAYMWGPDGQRTPKEVRPVDATACPEVETIVFGVRIYDTGPKQVGYEYYLNCP